MMEHITKYKQKDTCSFIAICVNLLVPNNGSLSSTAKLIQTTPSHPTLSYRISRLIKLDFI